jgi:hypothetical protein
MATKKRNTLAVAQTASHQELLKVGDRVRIRDFGGQRGKIVEYRGQLAPGGARVYRVLVKANRDYIELREDQLERVADKG